MLENGYAVLVGIGVQAVILVASTIWIAKWIYSNFKRG